MTRRLGCARPNGSGSAKNVPNLMELGFILTICGLASTRIHKMSRSWPYLRRLRLGSTSAQCGPIPTNIHGVERVWAGLDSRRSRTIGPAG